MGIFFFRFTLPPGFGIMLPFRRKGAGWFLERGADIVRELIGSVKPRKMADIPIHPRTQQFNCNAAKQSSVEM